MNSKQDYELDENESEFYLKNYSQDVNNYSRRQILYPSNYNLNTEVNWIERLLYLQEETLRSLAKFHVRLWLMYLINKLELELITIHDVHLKRFIDNEY